jgi:hypothetical protein
MFGRKVVVELLQCAGAAVDAADKVRPPPQRWEDGSSRMVHTTATGMAPRGGEGVADRAGRLH